MTCAAFIFVIFISVFNLILLIIIPPTVNSYDSILSVPTIFDCFVFKAFVKSLDVTKPVNKVLTAEVVANVATVELNVEVGVYVFNVL